MIDLRYTPGLKIKARAKSGPCANHHFRLTQGPDITLRSIRKCTIVYRQPRKAGLTVNNRAPKTYINGQGLPPSSPQTPLQPPTCLLCQVCPRPICQAYSSASSTLAPLAGSLGRVGFASQATGSLHTVGIALQPATKTKTWLVGVTRLSLPRASFILVGVLGGRLSLPV